jgi:hypothetical protein
MKTVLGALAALGSGGAGTCSVPHPAFSFQATALREYSHAEATKFGG